MRRWRIRLAFRAIGGIAADTPSALAYLLATQSPLAPLGKGDLGDRGLRAYGPRQSPMSLANFANFSDNPRSPQHDVAMHTAAS